jgi:hypothetical protein
MEPGILRLLPFVIMLLSCEIQKENNASLQEFLVHVDGGDVKFEKKMWT